MISALLAFTFYLRPPPVVSRIIEPAPIQVVTNFVDQVSYGMCPVPEKRCDVGGARNTDSTFRLQWICLGFSGGCEVLRNNQKLLSVEGAGSLDRLPFGTGSPITIRLTALDGSCSDSQILTP